MLRISWRICAADNYLFIVRDSENEKNRIKTIIHSSVFLEFAHKIDLFGFVCLSKVQNKFTVSFSYKVLDIKIEEGGYMTGGRLIKFQLIKIVFYHLIEIMLIT
jgi:hypothetical protein